MASFSCTARRLEYVAGSSNKFYTAVVADSSSGAYALFHWGARGTAGQFKVESFASRAAAERKVEDQVWSKQKKGYTVTLPRLPFVHTGQLSPSSGKNPPGAAALFASFEVAYRAALSAELALVSAAPGMPGPFCLLVLERFELESRSELLAQELKAVLPSLPHFVSAAGVLAVSLPAPAASALQRSYGVRNHLVDTLPAHPDRIVLETLLGVWTPAASGPMSSLKEAYSAARMLVGV